MSNPVPGRRTNYAALCSPFFDYLHLTGVAVSAFSPIGEQQRAFISDSIAGQIEQQQIARDRGPLVRCFVHGVFLEIPELPASAGATVEASAVEESTAAATSSSARAAFFFPLLHQRSCIGVITAYRTTPGPLGPNLTATGLALCQPIADQLVLSTDWSPEAQSAHYAVGGAFGREIHQAAGWLAAQFGISITESQARMLAEANAHGVSLEAVAERILARRLERAIG